MLLDVFLWAHIYFRYLKLFQLRNIWIRTNFKIRRAPKKLNEKIQLICLFLLQLIVDVCSNNTHNTTIWPTNMSAPYATNRCQARRPLSTMLRVSIFTTHLSTPVNTASNNLAASRVWRLTWRGVTRIEISIKVNNYLQKTTKLNFQIL